MLRLDISRPDFRFPETVRVGKGEVEEERSDDVFPATLSCRCVPHSCTTERSLGIFQSEWLFSTHLGLRVFSLLTIRRSISGFLGCFPAIWWVKQLIQAEPKTSGIAKKPAGEDETKHQSEPHDHIPRKLKPEDQERITNRNQDGSDSVINVN